MRGTGCGSSGGIGDVIPDGLFAGFVTGHDASNVSIDLLCIYAVATPRRCRATGRRSSLDRPDYVIVNNNTRARTMPMDVAIVVRLGVRDAADSCVDGTPAAQWSEVTPDRQVWVRIHDGTGDLGVRRVSLVLAGQRPPNVAAT